MRMRRFFKFSFFAFVLLLCCGCEGDVTRAIRHAGFSLSGDEFVCNAFFNEEGLTEDIRYLTGSHIITNYGRIYELSMGKNFSNGQNCKVAETEVKVKSLFDNNVFRADNGKIYRLVGDNENKAYSEIGYEHNDYQLYALLLGPVDVVKVVTVDSNNGIYYVLKSDGNVYGYSIYKGDRNQPPSIAGTNVVYNKADYGGDIIDFGYSGDSPATFVRTNDKVFHLIADNAEECQKYADIKCAYHMEEEPMFSEFGEYISAYNGSTIITNYKKVFTLGG